MSESDQRPPGGGEAEWTPRPVQDDSDWLFAWSRSTRQAPEPPPPSHDRSLWRPRPPRFGPLLDRVEARRLAPILDGSTVRMVDTPDGSRRALVHRHWIGLVLRLIAGLVAVVITIVSPAFVALVILSAAHGGVVSLRRGVKRETGALIGGSELVLGLLIGIFLSEGMLHATLILATLGMMALTVVAWQVDMELITEGGRLVRTRGLWLMKRTVTAPLTSIRIANTKGPFVGLGYVTVDTPSDNDDMLHNFGLIGQPNEWAALLLREASRPKVTSSAAAEAAQAD